MWRVRRLTGLNTMAKLTTTNTGLTEDQLGNADTLVKLFKKEIDGDTSWRECIGQWKDWAENGDITGLRTNPKTKAVEKCPFGQSHVMQLGETAGLYKVGKAKEQRKKVEADGLESLSPAEFKNFKAWEACKSKVSFYWREPKSKKPKRSPKQVGVAAADTCVKQVKGKSKKKTALEACMAQCKKLLKKL